MHEWLGIELARDKFEVKDHQRWVKLELGGLIMDGCIDRIDRGLHVDDLAVGESTDARARSAACHAIPAARGTIL